jgi:hypothetical protein
MAAWSLVALLCLSAVSGEETKVMYSLPPFSMVLQVKKSDNALIVFQDRLEAAVRDHLNTFLANKIATPNFDYGSVEEVALSSRMTWNEKEEEDEDFDAYTVPGQDPTTARHYEVHADYESQILLKLEEHVAASSLSQPIVDLLLIEAFEGDNYWALFHLFLSDSVLQEIEDVAVDVSTDGFRLNNGISTETQSKWTAPMKAGVAFASFFCVALVLMWVYLCLFVKGTLLFKEPIVHEGKDTEETVTEESSVNHDFGFSQEESSWMDQWARSITSIPVRQPTKPKKKKVRRPAQQHRPSLDQIEESSNSDEESWASNEHGDDCGDHLFEDVEMNEQGNHIAPNTDIVPYEPNDPIVQYEPSVPLPEGTSC